MTSFIIHIANRTGAVFLTAVLILPGCSRVSERTEPQPVRGAQEVHHSKVDLRGGFWGPRLKTHHNITIPYSLDCLEKDGHVTNFDKAAGKFDGPLKGHHAFDSDLYKALEGAVISIQHNSDSNLLRRVESIIDRILASQRQDGFLISCWIVKDFDKRWDDMRLQHQLYNAGHLFEMAVEHARLTGAPTVLDSAKRFADNIDSFFGPGKRYDVDGHQEVELALVRLYRATGEKRYLTLSKFFLDERGYVHGKEHKLFDPKTVVPPVIIKPAEGFPLTDDQRRANFHAQLRTRNGRMQDHKPVVDQLEAVGHAVRAGYMYSAMTDIVRFMEAPGYERALDSIWTDIVSRKMYITGGVGTGQYDDEGFGDPYLLPNDSAYCESCAAIAHMLWQHRMNLLKGEAKYADVMELLLYNSVLSGISISGNSFFYENPLASDGARRRPWISLSCCPSNLDRIIPQVGGFAYALGKNRLYVNLYLAGNASCKIDKNTMITLSQETAYPWDGRIKLTVNPGRPVDFDLCLRIPGWTQGNPFTGGLYRFENHDALNVELKLNGQKASAKAADDGYVHLSRSWRAGDVVELELPMPVQRVYAHENVKVDKGRVALMRGPIVYCIEASDQPDVKIPGVVMPKKTEFAAEYRADLMGGMTVLKGKALSEGNGEILLTAIPYYSWANREKGAMSVWIKEKE